MTQLIIEDRPIVLSPKLVCALGFEKATIIQQIYWLQNQPKSGVKIDGDTWVFNSYRQWCDDYFIFWQPETLRKHINKLEQLDLLTSCQPYYSSGNHMKYYRVNEAEVRNYWNDFLERMDGAEEDTTPPDDVTTPPEHDAGTPGTSDHLINIKDYTETSNKEPYVEETKFMRTPKAKGGSKSGKGFNTPAPKAPSPTPAAPPPATFPANAESFVQRYRERILAAGSPFLNIPHNQVVKTNAMIAALTPDDLEKMPDFVDWSFDNWAAIQKGDTILEKQDLPPLYFFYTPTWFMKYFTKFKSGAKLTTSFNGNNIGDERFKAAKEKGFEELGDDELGALGL